MATLKLDVAWEQPTETYNEALAELTAGLKLAHHATGVHTAGGWPEVQFTGDVDQLERLILRYANDRDEQVNLRSRVVEES